MDWLWRLGMKIAYRLLVAYWFVFRPTELGVYVAVWYGERVLLIRNSYKPGQTFPAGRVKASEDLAQAGCRELEEEVGFRIEPHELTFVREYESREEFKLDRSTVFEVRLDHEPVVKVDNREVIWAAFVGAEEARSRDLTPIVFQYLTERAAVDQPPESSSS